MNETLFYQNPHENSKKNQKQDTSKDSIFNKTNDKYNNLELEKYNTKELHELRKKINNTIYQRTIDNDEEKKIIIHRYLSNKINLNDKLTFEENLRAWTEDGINYYL